ncbi:CopG family ribbon-helix-helix protein [Pelotomaculum propionicicum]|uniref:CopG family ribbon-helix-helix protein n=1 Tax=Pelotomaculum propionicicum TaxID=258475 RepID=UPI003B7CA6EC
MSSVKRIMISLPDSLLAEVDGIAAADQLNRSEFIRKAMNFYITECKRRLLREQMKKGYLEMAKINLALVVEHYRLESEVKEVYELPVPEVK